ncbi:STAS domain-containing protein [Pseudonocardia sp. KRD-184]|uniref:STAS domain-containing protein n=1 Tax=Pseudonocardia oceani TaxID=2792013 RepID=A0ABS6UHN9_9PSEU|nr:STAS domain-containing protein [Pseudonocardia oceani]MBW0090271.1 STAS domain-containing protein [Pseudonocardia oceani]MBW0097477.1 STAS domain-containing protein [Pseudonocardia oceani]MBW0110106.1 STAS domain-containing protein [Pseudonocardia oceani]MBW0122257.1 STAS domain-containing protein [Pseudonocardia oceani]MBW0131765.1 STAS domain-containing protein [Pseudonocardia oceani]
MTVVVQDHDATTVVTLVGAVDALTAPRLREALRHAVDALDGRVLVVDLTAVQFLGPPGLRALADSAREASTTTGCGHCAPSWTTTVRSSGRSRSSGSTGPWSSTRTGKQLCAAMDDRPRDDPGIGLRGSR